MIRHPLVDVLPHHIRPVRLRKELDSYPRQLLNLVGGRARSLIEHLLKHVAQHLLVDLDLKH